MMTGENWEIFILIKKGRCLFEVLRILLCQSVSHNLYKVYTSQFKKTKLLVHTSY